LGLLLSGFVGFYLGGDKFMYGAFTEVYIAERESEFTGFREIASFTEQEFAIRRERRAA
jgi:hypothetical protein